MGPESKDLLPLEERDSSIFSLESSLFICKNKASVSRNKPLRPVPRRVKDFLGVISEANRRLEIDAKENPGSYDIELLDGNESQIIEMDLMLGMADLHTPEAIAATESSIAGSMSTSSGGTDSEDGTDDDGEKSRVVRKLRKHNSLETTGKNQSKKQRSKWPKVVDLPRKCNFSCASHAKGVVTTQLMLPYLVRRTPKKQKAQYPELRD